MSYEGSYVWRIRQKIGSGLLLLPGAQILVLRPDGNALFQRRVDNGLWELPAGSCEPGQSFADAAVTELFEETGIQVQPQDLLPFGCLSDPRQHTLSYPNGDQVQAFAMCFYLSDWEGTVTPETAEVAEIKFFPLDAIPEPTHGPTLEVIRLFELYRQTGSFQPN